jgi:hypothetical protein
MPLMATNRASQILTIPARFNGPPGSANGGYTCGLLSRLVDGPTRAILRRPPPLDQALLLETADGNAVLSQGDEIVATATPTVVDPLLPTPPSFESARRASVAYQGHVAHPFPTCFVCGPQRMEDDGLRIFPGPVPGTEFVACPWVPGTGLADAEGVVGTEFVWSALDCPTGWAHLRSSARRVIVLGTLSVAQRRDVHPGHPYVLAAWPTGRQGRRLLAAGALWSADGRLHAVAEATWIELLAEGDVR